MLPTSQKQQISSQSISSQATVSSPVLTQITIDDEDEMCELSTIPTISYELSFTNNKNTLITEAARTRLISPNGKFDDLVIEAFMSANSLDEYDLFVLSSTAATHIAQNGECLFKNKNQLGKYSFIAGPVYDKQLEH